MRDEPRLDRLALEAVQRGLLGWQERHLRPLDGHAEATLARRRGAIRGPAPSPRDGLNGQSASEATLLPNRLSSTVDVRTAKAV